MLWTRLAVSALCLLGAGCATLAPPAAPAVDAQAFAERACAGCHAVGRTDASRNPRAPAFRDLARNRTDAQLAAAIAAVSANGHVEMPPIYVTPDEQAGLVRYLRSLTGQRT